MILVSDVYGPQAQTRMSAAASAPTQVTATGALTSSASGSASASGMPAAWFLAVCGAAFLILHFGGGE